MRSQQLADPLNRPVEGLRVGAQVIDFDWRYVRVNLTAATHVRRLGADLEGQSMLDLYPDIENTAMFRLLERCMNDRVSDEFEDLFTYPDGDSRWFDMRVEPVWEGICVYSIDIHERKRWRFELDAAARALGIQPLTRRQWQSLTGGQVAES
jgi:hypothetical protein